MNPQPGDRVGVTDGPYTEGKEHIGGCVIVAAPDLDALVRFCRHAEECEFESLLTAFSFATSRLLVASSSNSRLG